MDTPTGVSNAITGLFYAVFCYLVCANPRSYLLFSRKRLVATESRREGVYNRAGERSVTFCEEGTPRNE